MSDEQRRLDEEREDRLYRGQIRPYAIAIIILAGGGSCLFAYQGVRSSLRAYELLRTEGLQNAAAIQIGLVLLIVTAVLGGLKSVSYGVRMIAAANAHSRDRLRRLDPLTGYRSSERLGSPTMRFISAVLPVFFSLQHILGTVVTYQGRVPISSRILPHYGSMIFMGLAFITYSWSNSRFEGIDLSAADREQSREAAFRKSRIRGFGLRLAGIWAGLLGTLMMVDAVVLSTRFSDATGFWRFFCVAMPVFLVYFGLAVQGAGKNFLRYSRRHLTRVIRSPSALDGETFVLYLRTFRSDNLQAGFRRHGPAGVFASLLTSGRSEEEQVAMAFRPIGPMVAVGRPGEPLPYVGAVRMYLPKENWQEPVRDLMTRARMVVIVLGPSAGTMWEVREALRILPPERLVLLVPAQAENYRPVQAADLRAGLVRVTLPPHPSAGRMRTALRAVISFAPGWKPVLGTFDESPLRPAAYRNLLLSALRFQLRPVFRKLREYELSRTS